MGNQPCQRYFIKGYELMDILTANDRQGEYPKSFYAHEASALETQESLLGKKIHDFCIIGGGFTGLCAALELAKAGQDVALCEAHRIGFGASGRNGGQLGSGLRKSPYELRHKFTLEQNKIFWQLGENAKEYIHDLAKSYNIDYQFQQGILYTDHKESFQKDTEAFVDYMQEYYPDSQISFIERETLHDMLKSQAYHSAYLDLSAGHLQPLSLALGMGRVALEYGAKIYENTRIIAVDEHHNHISIKAENGGEIHAKKLLYACNGYLDNLEKKISNYVMPINNFVIATRTLSEAENPFSVPYAVCDSKYVVNYFRMNHENRLIFGGHESYGYEFPSNIAAKVRRPLSDILPQLSDIKIDYAWGGTLAITRNRLPFVRQLSPHIYNASGYSGHGVALASYCGKLMAQAMQESATIEFKDLHNIKHKAFPGGRLLRTPLLILAMLYYSSLDKITKI
jgi:gamma-glutamylputrescine oxidase